MKNVKMVIVCILLFSISCAYKPSETDSTKAIDIDGNVYRTVQIGDQLWMLENLKVKHYRDGSEIINLCDSEEWTTTKEGSYCVYEDDKKNKETYGYLYNWYAVDDARGLAPEGWHVPSDVELLKLEMYLGMSEGEANGTGWRGTNQGSQLAGRADLWTDKLNLESNYEFGKSGLNLLPSGYRGGGYGFYYSLGSYGYLWTSSESNRRYVWYRISYNKRSEFYRFIYDKRSGFSVRCIKD